MGEMLNMMMTGPVKIAVAAVIIIVIIMYLLSIVWVIKDARHRGASAVMWGIIAIIPIAGLLAYCLLRPSLASEDQEALDMELALMRYQLGDYGNCPHCGYVIQKDFVACPHCHKQLRNVCTCCHKVLDADWTICPYCTTPVGNGK